MKNVKSTWGIPALTVLLCAVCLGPIIFFPISPDLAVFAQGGRVLLEGGAMYRDFIDVKPPLVFYILAFVQWLFGSSEVALRLFDFSWQMLTCLSLYLTVRRSGFGKLSGLLSAGVYAIIYSTHSAVSTMQCESFGGIALIWSLYFLHSRPRDMRATLFAGLLIGFVIALKYTMVIVLAALLVYDLTLWRQTGQNFMQRWCCLSLGLVLALGLFLVWPLTPPGVWQPFSLMLDFLLDYNAITGFGSDAVRRVLAEVPWYFADQLSILVSAGVAWALFKFMAGTQQFSDAQRNYLGLLLLTAFCLLISVVIERKLFAYHFSRMLVVLLPLSGIGLAAIAPFLLRAWRSSNLLVRSVVVAACLGLVVFSPLPRYVNQVIPAVHFFVDPAKYDARFEQAHVDESIMRLQYKQVTKYVNSRRGTQEMPLVLATHAAKIHAFLDLPHTPKFPSSQFYASPMAPREWREDFYRDLGAADWLIVQNNDRFEIVTGTDVTSAEFLERDVRARQILTRRFVPDTSFASFTVYCLTERARR